MNTVALTGRITKDLEVTKTQSGMSILRFTLAVNRAFTNKNGEREADFISCVAFDKRADTMATYLSKGSLVGITGRIQTGSYDNKDGVRVYTTDVMVEGFDFLESKSPSTRPNDFQQPSRPQPAAKAPSNDFFSDFESTSSTGNILDSLDISDDELPF